jgi:hypothetical protein
VSYSLSIYYILQMMSQAVNTERIESITAAKPPAKQSQQPSHQQSSIESITAAKPPAKLHRINHSSQATSKAPSIGKIALAVNE